jgi:endonuclease/exonuclease/phosphatase family metal-dependent hydrolase
MKIYSWNMLFRNAELDRAFAFIRDSDWDIFCLQEVPQKILDQLQTLPSFIAYRTDADKIYRSGMIRSYNVILSRYPIQGHREIPFPEYGDLFSWRTRLFVFLMRPFHFSKLRNRGGLCIDITVEGRPVRVFNLHLILAQPAWRLREFESAMTDRNAGQPTIVCGDFNIVESLHITPLNWLFGGRVSEMLLPRRERTHIEKRFVEHELLNPLRGKSTHPLSRSQLDHILVSKTFSIKNAEVLPDRIGSDHCPIRVEIF